MTTTDVFRRVLWKEYRVLRAFWLALVAIVVGSQALAWTYLPTENSQPAFQGIVIVAVTLYALAAGAILFAVEREEGTEAFLQAIPVTGHRLFTAKVTLAVASTLALFGLLSLIILIWKWAGLLVPPRTVPGTTREGMYLVGSFITDVFACGLLCSLLLKRPLVAACVGAGLAMLIGFVASLLAIRLGPPHIHQAEDVQLLWASLIVGLSACVIVIDVWLGRHWLNLPKIAFRQRRATRTRASVVARTAGETVSRAAPFWPAFGRLAWQELRQTWRVMLILLGLATVWGGWVATFQGPADARTRGVIPLAVGMVAIMGACVFMADQERSQFRFFAERPVRPRMVWANRHLVWLAIVAGFFTIAVLLWTVIVLDRWAPLTEPFLNVARPQDRHLSSFTGSCFQLPGGIAFAVFLFVAYSCGQLCSMLFRSTIIAGFLGCILASFASSWCALMGAMGVNWLVSVAPLPVILLAVTWWWAPYWIGERGGWRLWTRLGLSLGVPLVALGVATAAYRVVQIPQVSPGFSLEQYLAADTPAARETGEMYLRAASMIRMEHFPRGEDVVTGRGDVLAAEQAGRLPLQRAALGVGAAERRQQLLQAQPHAQNMLPWLEDNQEALNLALNATARPACILPQYTDLSRLEFLLGTEAFRRGSNGDLDGMLDVESALLRMSNHRQTHQGNYAGAQSSGVTLEVLTLYWATLPGQTPELLRRAIREIEDWQRTVPGNTDPIETRYFHTLRLLDQDPDALAMHFGTGKDSSVALARYAFLAHVLPWEVTRARRGLNALTAHALQVAHAINDRIEQAQPTSPWSQPHLDSQDDWIQATTPWLREFRPNIPPSGEQEIWLQYAARRKVSLVLLALQAWRLEHNSLPDSLEQLVGPYLNEMPRDPYSGAPFQYFPHGAAVQTTLKSFQGAIEISAEAPFLWSSGSHLTPVVGDRAHDETYIWGNDQRQPLLDVLLHGITIPLPVAVRDAGSEHDRPAEEPQRDESGEISSPAGAETNDPVPLKEPESTAAEPKP